jgi:uncharacterized protein (DUF2336 family)
MSSVENLISELSNAIDRGTAESRARALDYLTDMLLSASDTFSVQQADLLDELFLRLSLHIEQETRRILAVRLADSSRAPRKIMAALALDDEIEVARPVLTRSERIDEPTLLKVVTIKGQDYLLAVSDRRIISPAITDVLVRRGDQGVLLNTARNSGAAFSTQGYKRLVERSHNDDSLTQCVGARADIPNYLFAELVTKASQFARDTLIALHPDFAAEIRQTTAEVAGVLRTTPRPGIRNYAAAENRVAELKAEGRLGVNALESFARSKQFEETVVALAVMAAVSPEIVERAMMQEQLDLIIMIARTADLPWPSASLVLLLRSDILGLADPPLEQLHINFERIKPAIAQQAVRLFVARKSRENSAHA